ncbi:MAG: hypothetical protein HYW78_02820 [Parcubacteria group bacterium]|nr:hypothetical protein [Parcubacteria group bacterium]
MNNLTRENQQGYKRRSRAVPTQDAGVNPAISTTSRPDCCRDAPRCTHQPYKA